MTKPKGYINISSKKKIGTQRDTLAGKFDIYEMDIEIEGPIDRQMEMAIHNAYFVNGPAKDNEYLWRLDYQRKKLQTKVYQ